MLRALGHTDIKRFHMNEGHAGLLALELLAEHAREAGRKEIAREDVDAVRERCIFTTHTPVPAGHDQFPMDLVHSVLTTHREPAETPDIFCIDVVDCLVDHGREYFDTRHVVEGAPALNMTYLALNLSGYVNGVAKKHGEISRLMFAEYAIDSMWWVEGWIEGKTGWSIGDPPRPEEAPDRAGDAVHLCEKLEKSILSLFYRERERYVETMRSCIAVNGSFFNTHRMILQYVARAYFR